MLKKLKTLLKNHWVKIVSSLLAGLLIGGGIMYSIEQQQEDFWREKYIQQTHKTDSLQAEVQQLNDNHHKLLQENKKIRDDLGVTILSSIRSNFYDLKALKSDDYNTQLYYNREEYKSNLVPKTIGEKWNINIFNQQYKSELRTLMDSIYKAKNQEKQ